jgi:hypothetical protein
MSDRDRAPLEDFIAELNRAWKIAGPPSYKDFEKLSMEVEGPAGARDLCLPHSTTQDMLAGRHERPPKWRRVARFITVLQAAARQVEVDPAKLGTLEEWKQKHEAVCAAMADVPKLARAAGNEHTLLPDPAAPRTRVLRRATGLLLNEIDIHRDLKLAAMLRAVGKDWCHSYRDLLPAAARAYLSLEPAASVIRAYETALMPRWIQTEEYAAEAIRLSLLTPDREVITRLVELRMRRQEFLEQEDAPQLWVLVEEAAVRHRLGTAGTMRRQIEHLMEVSQHDNITVQVIPSDTSVHAVASGPITFLRFSDPDLPDVVYLEQLAGTVYLPGHGSVSHYTEVLSLLGIEALEPAATTDFIYSILREI